MANEKKHVGTTLKTILENPVMQVVMDRSQSLHEVIEAVKGYWGYDMYTRKPGPALVDGVFEGTDLDLACFLTALAERGAVINIPTYKSSRPSTIVEGQRVVSKDNRHGKIVKLVSNKDVFSFGINIMDMNVMTTDSVGDFRTFSLTSPDGNWYDGWSSIQFDPSAKENAFLTENKIWTGNQAIFKYFVHPNRWISLYGQYYFITKALIARLTEQAADNFVQMKAMLDAGIKYPESGDDVKKEWPASKKEPGKSVKFESLEVEIDIPEYKNEYTKYEFDQKNLILLANQRRLWNNTIIPTLNFSARITEYAFYKYGRKVEGGEKMPAWLSGGTTWERNFKFPKKKIEWDRLKLVQPGVGEYSVAIRKRVKTKSEIMAMSFNGGIK